MTLNTPVEITWEFIVRRVRFSFDRIAEEHAQKGWSAMERQFLALAVGGIVALMIGFAVAVYHPRRGVLLQPGLQNFQRGSLLQGGLKSRLPIDLTCEHSSAAAQEVNRKDYSPPHQHTVRAACNGTNTFASHSSRGSCEVAEC